VRDGVGRETSHATFWVAMWGPDSHELEIGDRTFTAQFAGIPGAEYVDPALIRADLDDLVAGAKRVSDYVDQYIAHLDAKPKAMVPTFSDLDRTLDLLGTLYQKYFFLLTAEDVHLDMVNVDHDWTAVFRQPWIRPRQRQTVR
jgi:hypothetical protein